MDHEKLKSAADDLHKILTELLTAINETAHYTVIQYQVQILGWLQTQINAVELIRRSDLRIFNNAGVQFGLNIIQFNSAVTASFLNKLLGSDHNLEKAVSETVEILRHDPSYWYKCDTRADKHEFLRGIHISFAALGLQIYGTFAQQQSPGDRKHILKSLLEQQAPTFQKYAMELTLARIKKRSLVSADLDGSGSSSNSDSDTDSGSGSDAESDSDSATLLGSKETGQLVKEEVMSPAIESLVDSTTSGTSGKHLDLPSPVYRRQLPVRFIFQDIAQHRIGMIPNLPSTYPTLDESNISKMTPQKVTKALTLYDAYTISLDGIGSYQHDCTSSELPSRWLSGSIKRENLPLASQKYVDALRGQLKESEPWKDVFDWTIARLSQPNRDEIQVICQRSPKCGLDIKSAYMQAQTAPLAKPFPQRLHPPPPPPPPHIRYCIPAKALSRRAKARKDFYDVEVEILLPGTIKAGDVQKTLDREWCQNVRTDKASP